MTDTIRHQCTDCGEISMQNPRRCPNCGHSIMRPVETSEPGQDEHEMTTDNFDVDRALARLNNDD